MGLMMITMIVPSLAHAGSLADANLVTTANWQKWGGASIDTASNIFTLSEREGEREYVWQDINISGTVARYVTLISYTKAEEVRPSPNITGLPYVYGYAMDGNQKILAYLQGQDMLNNSAANQWDVSSGIFSIPSGTQKIRFFLNQAAYAETIKNGSDAIFFQPGVFLSLTSSEAQAVVSEYGANLPSSTVVTTVTTSTTPATTTTTTTSTTPTTPTISTSTDNAECKNDRSELTVRVGVDRLVYADDSDSDTANEKWNLWVANSSTSNSTKWDSLNPFATSSDSFASGTLCAKKGDTILINGSYVDGSANLVYALLEGKTVVGSDRIRSIRIGGKSYHVFTNQRSLPKNDRGCTFVLNASGNYDLSCVVK